MCVLPRIFLRENVLLTYNIYWRLTVSVHVLYVLLWVLSQGKKFKHMSGECCSDCECCSFARFITLQMSSATTLITVMGLNGVEFDL